MTPAEINAEVARLCGWTLDRNDWAGDLPNYHGSRDACASFEAGLVGHERGSYHLQLVHLGNGGSDAENLCHATPAQRCEAFLRLRGKWRD